ncbi:IS1634 family transposase [Coleofasciculus sp. G2-EDA-02]|uniref:IS1634 family transposase n=1 Tax=Coleofasciculus sp. G2-EDA-02 TaxID=3069529 RepID=UPI0032FC83EF
MNSLAALKIQTINHLGLIAGLVDEIGIEKIINDLLGVETREIISAGQVVKGIILNGLGFVSRPLYLFPQFFEDKATEHLLGEGIEPKHLNDDKIGRVMDKLYRKGLSDIFLVIALAAIEKYGISTEFSHLDATSSEFSHLDATSLSLHGQYEGQLASESDSGLADRKETEEITHQPKPIKITHGYSRDRRPDLKQFVIDLIVSGDGDIPLFLRVADGNETDKGAFGQIVKDYKAQVDFSTLIVSDSALYSKKNLLLMKGIEWLCRVPLSIKEAKTLVSSLSNDELEASPNPGYSYCEVKSQYGGVEQRWLVVESQVRKASDLEKLEKKIKEEASKILKKFWKLVQKEFSSYEEAVVQVKLLSKTLNYHQIRELKVTEFPSRLESKSSQNQSQSSSSFYKITGSVQRNDNKIESDKRRAGRFVLATNRMKVQEFTASDILQKYKDQQAPERSFAFLKDPLFFADSVFLKSPERIETMAMLMGLCLLVYAIGQRQLRQNLSSAQVGLKNQLGQLTDHPTLKWIFQGFQGIHIVFLAGLKQIVNLTDERQFTLSFFPQSSQNYYVLSG